jgi:hypothetical protein
LTLSPAELLGLPAPDVMEHVARFRWALAALALLWSASILKGRDLLSLLVGILFVEAAVLFWVLSLGRPYGLLVDPATTRLTAEASVVAETGRTDEGALAASRPVSPAAAFWGRLSLPRQGRLLLPTLLPLVAPAVLGLAVALLWGRRDRATLGASLWLAFGTGELDALGGGGFVTGIWPRPLATLALLALVPALLLSSRIAVRRGAEVLQGVLAAGALLVVPASGPSPGALGLLRWLTLDQGLWLPIGLYGLARSRDAAPRVLALGGLLAVLGAGFGAPVEAWAGHALYRLGLLLAAAEPLAVWAEDLGRGIGQRPGLAGRGLQPLSLGTALLFAVAVPGSFLAWWDPPRLDPVAKASLAPLSPNLLAPMDWIRRETPPESVFIANEDYSAAVAALAGRRVLRAPLLAEAQDDERRQRTERLIVSGTNPAQLRARYRVSHVLVAPGDFRAHGLGAPEDLEAHAGFRRLYRDAEGLRVYGLE